MRTFERRGRYPITTQNELETFAGELEYYRTHNTFPVILFGKNITNIYKNINVQVVLTKRCNFKCQFCIENDGITGGREECCPSPILDSLLGQYKAQGIEPCVSITGGEPTLYPKRLLDVWNVCRKHGITKVNVNTNGARINDIIEGMKGIRVNMSRHHYLPDKIYSSFGNNSLLDGIKLNENYVMQCVMMKGYIDSISEMKKYMNCYSCGGVSGFSFRGLSRLDAGKEYSKEINFSAAHAIDFFSIVEQVSNDSDFEFVQQKIGDHYWFEIYKYQGKFVRFTYSNFEFLRQVESQERSEDKWFSRATIVSPFGKVYAGWTYDINEIV